MLKKIFSATAMIVIGIVNMLPGTDVEERVVFREAGLVFAKIMDVEYSPDFRDFSATATLHINENSSDKDNGFAVAPDGDIYFTAGTSEIKRFSPEGDYLGIFTKSRRVPKMSIYDIAIDTSGTLFALVGAPREIYIEGRHLALAELDSNGEWGKPVLAPPLSPASHLFMADTAGNLCLVGDQNTIYEYNVRTNSFRTIKLPHPANSSYVFVNEHARTVIADTAQGHLPHSKPEIVHKDGREFIYLRYPRGKVAILVTGKLITFTNGSPQVELLDENGSPKATIRLPTPFWFANPKMFCADVKGNVYFLTARTAEYFTDVRDELWRISPLEAND